MNTAPDKLATLLLKKESLEQCTVEELEQLSQKYPYSAAFHLMLSAKLKGADAIRYEKSLQTTSLLFHDPLRLQGLLNENGQAVINAPSPVITEQITKEENETKAVETTDTDPDREVSQEMQPGITVTAVSKEIKKEEPLFEPYHTIDYFASLGIKFKEEIKPGDKFGQQLKSFTEWLKALKRLPLSELTQNIEGAAEKKVEQMAEQSLRDENVITEAMAEVWIKQGNPLKAMEVYQKLSLLEPAKSAYFAAKIEELKKTN